MWTFLVVFSAALGACALEEPPTTGDLRLSLVNANAEAGVLDGDAPAEAGPQAISLYQEMAARLDERGYTPDELLAAGQAGDEQLVREMLGYTDAEFEAMYERLQAIGTAPASDANYPEGWTCQPEVIPCITSLGLAYLVRGGSISVPALLAYGGIHVIGCVYTYCSYDRTDPGPPVVRP